MNECPPIRTYEDLRAAMLWVMTPELVKAKPAAETAVAGAVHPEPSFTADTLETLADKMGDGRGGRSGRDCEHMLRELIGRPRLSPNPHPHGTYLWAHEEHKRGRTVQLLAVEGGRDGYTITPKGDWDAVGWKHHEIIATDWVAS